MRHLRRLIYAGLLLVAVNAWSAAQVREPIEVFKRCYVRMTRLLPNEGDALYIQVKTNKKSAANACAELFDRAKFNADGVLVNRESVESKAIVKNLHALHRSWFAAKVKIGPTADYLVRDFEEAPLYFTRAAFAPNIQFKSVVTLNSGLAGVRDQDTYPTEAKDFVSQRVFNYNSKMSYAKETDLLAAYSEVILTNNRVSNISTKALRLGDGAVTEVGALVGIKPAVRLPFPSFVANFTNENIGLNPELFASMKELQTGFDGNRHLGGGIIGSQSFITRNVNLLVRDLPKGFSQINRRMTSRVFEDLLCHQLPTLTDADVSTEVIPTSEYTFQQSTSCMRCHSSIDGMAFGYRNVFIYDSSPSENRQEAGVRINGVAALPTHSGATTFALQPPVGRLHYRELITNTRKSANFSSLTQLGDQLSKSDDLYVCAAKRYYKFFTGVDVSLAEAAVKPVDKAHQDKVLELGRAFKNHQSVRTLLQQIFASPAFQSSNYLTELEQ